jgi:hypothetical protein
MEDAARWPAGTHVQGELARVHGREAREDKQIGVVLEELVALQGLKTRRRSPSSTV